MGGGQGGQFGDGFGVAAQFQLQFEPGLQEGQAPLLQPGALGLDVRAREAGQRFAVPQGQRGVQQRPGAAAVPGGARLLRLRRVLFGVVVVEVEGVAVRRPDRIAAGLADQRIGVRAERLADPGGVGAQRGQRGVRRLVAPQGVDQFGRGGGVPAAQQQCGQQRPLLRGARHQGRFAAPGPYGTEHGEAEPLLPLPRTVVHRLPLPCPIVYALFARIRCAQRSVCLVRAPCVSRGPERPQSLPGCSWAPTGRRTRGRGGPYSVRPLCAPPGFPLVSAP